MYKVNENARPLTMHPPAKLQDGLESKVPSSAVTLWGLSPWSAHTTVSPWSTVISLGWKELSAIVTFVVAAPAGSTAAPTTASPARRPIASLRMQGLRPRGHAGLS